MGATWLMPIPPTTTPRPCWRWGRRSAAAGRGGERRIPIASFFTGPFTTALRGDEIVTEIRVPVPAPRSGGAYLKLERKVGDFATAAVAVQLTLDAAGACDTVGIGLTNVGSMPISATKARRGAQGRSRTRPRSSAAAGAGRGGRGSERRSPGLGRVQEGPGAGY